MSHAPEHCGTVAANGIDIEYGMMGEGPVLLLLHGWPHTWRLWLPVMQQLSATYRVIAPDLRGIGGTTRAQGGYDLHTLADDLAGLLDALDVSDVAAVVGIDAGVPVAWMLAMRHADRVQRIVLMEGLLGALPGAEAFLARGAPWWFGFHAIPGFAEQLTAGREALYLDFFLNAGTVGGRGIWPEARDAFVAAYARPDAMRCGFEYYRAMPGNARQIAEILETRRVTQPVLAIAGGVVGAALHGQLLPICDDLSAVAIADTAHIIPQEQPAALAQAIDRFVSG